MRCMRKVAFTYAVEISCLWAIRVDVQNVQIQMVGEMMVGDTYIPRGVHVNVSKFPLYNRFVPNVKTQKITHPCFGLFTTRSRIVDAVADSANKPRTWSWTRIANWKPQQAQQLGPLPSGWEMRLTASSRLNFVDHTTLSLHIPQCQRDYRRKLINF